MASRLGLESAEYLFGYGTNRRCFVGGDFCNFLESTGITDFAQSSKSSDTHHHLWIGRNEQDKMRNCDLVLALAKQETDLCTFGRISLRD